MFIHLRNNVEIVLISFLFVGLVYSSFSRWSFGYEYEDTVVYSWYAIDSDIPASTQEFRTNVLESINNEVVRHHYPGHFVTYGLFLKMFIFDIYENRPDLIHKTANSFLLLTCLIILCCCNMKLQAILFLSAMSTQYVLGSSLAENLSVFFALTLLLAMKYSRYVLAIILLTCLVLVKRDSLIYVFPVFVLLLREKKLNMLILLSFILALYMLIINPFYTEIIESEGLGRPSFSQYNFLTQSPYYFAFALSPFITPFVFMDFTKDKLLLATLILGLLMYSVHYRSYYILNGLEQFKEFHSWRYLYNLIPLILVMNVRIKRKYIIVLATFISIFNLYRLDLLLAEEDHMYRNGDYINSEFYIKSELNRAFLDLNNE
jgi:hypothetical protein